MNKKDYIWLKVIIFILAILVYSTYGAALKEKFPKPKVEVKYSPRDLVLHPKEGFGVTLKLTNIGEGEADYGKIHVELPSENFQAISARCPRCPRGERDGNVGQNEKKAFAECYFFNLKRRHQRICEVKFKAKLTASGSSSRILYSGELTGEDGGVFCDPSCKKMKRGRKKIKVLGPETEVNLIEPKLNLILTSGEEFSIKTGLKNSGNMAATQGRLKIELSSENFQVISAHSKAIGSESNTGTEKGKTYGECNFLFGIPSGNSERTCEVKFKVKSGAASGGSKIKYSGWLKNSFGKLFSSPPKLGPELSILSTEKNPRPEVNLNLVTYQKDKVSISITLKNLGDVRAEKGGIYLELSSKNFKVFSIEGGKENKKGKNIAECYFQEIKPKEQKICTFTFKADGEKFVVGYPKYKGWLLNEEGEIFCNPTAFGEENCIKKTKTGQRVIIDMREIRGHRKYVKYMLKPIRNCFKEEED